MYTPPPKADPALGLTPDDFPEQITEVWPDNWPVVDVFAAMSTQWRTGYAGPTGLDYAALPFVFRACNIRPDARASVFEDVRVMEQAALELMGAQRGK